MALKIFKGDAKKTWNPGSFSWFNTANQACWFLTRAKDGDRDTEKSQVANQGAQTLSVALNHQSIHDQPARR